MHGPGYNCEPAFPDETDNPRQIKKNLIFSNCNCYSLETLLLCNKTSKGPGFSKTEIQTLDTQILKLEGGECEQFQNDGFRCVEHYQCIGKDVRLITDGDSQTRW